jgi:Zn-finger nucleic acid-binding protein
VTSLETRYPCPVCLGVSLRKIRVTGSDELVLDHCARCGGVWFDAGEVQALRRAKPEALWAQMARRDAVQGIQCHSCHSPIDRAATNCVVCGWECRLDCPMCQQPMQHAEHAGLRLDVCTKCRGVWFDHQELAAIWKAELNAAVQKRHARLDVASGAQTSSLVLLDALTYDPFLALYAANAGAHLLGASAGALSNAPAIVGSAAEVVVEAAQSVFEAILEILSGLS